MRHRSAAIAAALALAGLPGLHAQSARPVPTGPVNVIRPSQPEAAPVVDTGRTVFFAGPRPAPPPAEDVPGHELVTWRSTSPLVRGVAGADAAYLAAFEGVGGADRRAPIGRSAGPVFIAGAFPVIVGDIAGGGQYVPIRQAAPRTVSDQFPRPWIGGVRWDIPSAPIVEPPRNTAIYPIRRRP